MAHVAAKKRFTAARASGMHAGEAATIQLNPVANFTKWCACAPAAVDMLLSVARG
jgi:hypothetical protein